MNAHAHMPGQISGQVTSQPAPQVSGTPQQFANSLASQIQNLGPQTMDPNVLAYRKAMSEKICNFIQRNASSDEFLRKAPEAARRLEDRIFKDVASMDDYIKIVLDPAERHLQSYLRLFAQKQHPSHHIASSSAHSTMIPTPGISHNGITSTAFPGSVENRSVAISGAGVSSHTSANMGNSQQTVNGITNVGTNASFKTSDGLVSNSYQQTSNYAFSSSGGGIPPSMATTNVPRQSPQMIPTPGLGNQHPVPALSEFSSVANYSSNDSTMAITSEQQNKYFGVQNDSIVHSFGGQIGAGIRSNMTHKSSAYGISNGIKNNGIGLVANNTQLTGAAMSEGLMGNSSYSSSLKPVHQHFGQQQQQQQQMRVPCTLNPPSSLQSMQCSPHIRNQMLDYQNKMNFQMARTMNEHLRQPQLSVQQSAQVPNQTYTQFGQNQHQLQRQQNLQNQQFMIKSEMPTQATMPSGFSEDLLPGNTVVTHSESLISQTQQVQLSDFQSQYRQNTSFMDHARSAQVLDHASGLDFHVPAPQGSGAVLQESHQQIDEFTKVSSFSDQLQIEDFPQVPVRTQPAAPLQILGGHGGGQHLQEMLHQRIKGQDVARQPYNLDKGLISSAETAPKDSTVSGGTVKSAQDLDYRNQCKWLLFLWHARSCLAPKGQCLEVNCITVQDLLAHMRNCRSDVCMYPRCFKSSKLLKHYNTCSIAECPVCAPVRDHLLSNQTTYRALHGSEFTSQIKVEPDRMKVDTASVEDFDNKQALPKRMRIEDASPALSICATSPVSVPPVHEPSVFKEEQLHDCHKDHTDIATEFTVTNTVIEEPTGIVQENCTNSGSGVVGVASTARCHVDSAAPNYVDSSIKQESLAVRNYEECENVQVKSEVSDPPADQATSSKSGKPKIKGVSLTELFTSEQIREHISSLRQWVGQGKAKAEKNQAMEHSMTENSCQLCAVEKLNFDPPPIYCSLCGARIKRNAMYYTIGSGDTRNFFCVPCYNEVRGDSIEVDGSTFQKTRMEKKRNDEETEEWWVQCDKCEAWQHQICGLFNGRRNDGGQAEYTCPNCYIVELERGERKPLPQSAVLGAKDLPRTILSDHIEQRLFRRLRHERAERAKHLGKSYDEVQGAEGLVVRVVSSVDKKLEVKPRFLEIFQEENYPKEFPYKSKAVLLFQRIEGVEVCLFGMYVQEFGSECAFPNQRRVYLSYLDSVKYFRPDIKTVNGEALRTFVYHEILIGYLEYCKKRGFTSCYIWACPPLKGEDYILYCHPEIQKTPKSDKLREWYLSMLRKALKENIVVELVNLYDHFFAPTGECRAKVTAARLPYFEGDYWPGAAEDMITILRQEEDGRNKQKKGKTKNTITKRALKAAGQTDLSGNASKDAMLMQKLGETISPMKEDFIMVHLQHCCNHCCILMVSGTRWVCHQCKNFQLCDKCYDVERRTDERDRHPIHSREKHIFYPNEINDVPTDTRDKDEILESEFFDTRQAFLSLCQGNHYQYDTLRRAKHSSMMVLYHLHNPTAPAFVTTCNVCHNDIEAGKGWRCESCPEFDVCNACYQKGGIDHPHKLTNHPSMADHDAQNKEARQQRVLQLRKMLDLLVHASQCRFPHCQYPNCRKVKGLFRHGIQCRVRASGGCVLCKKMWLLLQIHARACKESECTVPRCRDLREHLRRLQQQSDSRRRAAVMEMMRQRAAEVSGNS